MVREGEMPPWFYLPMHAGARLSNAEQAEFVRGLTATFGGDAGGGRSDEGDEGEDQR
jgi:hypothetical protein